MSDIEKIRQEIERRIENYWSDGDVDSVVVSGMRLSKISSLVQIGKKSTPSLLHKSN